MSETQRQPVQACSSQPLARVGLVASPVPGPPVVGGPCRERVGEPGPEIKNRQEQDTVPVPSPTPRELELVRMKREQENATGFWFRGDR